MKRWLATSLLAISVISIQTNAFADGLTSGWYTIPEAGSGTGVVGQIFSEDLGGNWDQASRVINNSPARVCSSALDADCSMAHMILAPCEVDAAAACIESVQLTSANKFSVGKFDRLIGSESITGYVDHQIPNGYSQSIWKVPGFSTSAGNDELAVFAKLFFATENTVYKNDETKGFHDLAVSVSPFKVVNDPTLKAPQFVANPSTNGIYGNNSYHDCVWVQKGQCGSQVSFPKDTSVTLKLKINKTLNGWFNARLEQPSISIEPIDANFNRLTVSGVPATIQKAYAKLYVDNLPSEIDNFLKYKEPHGQIINTLTANDPDALQVWNLWSKYFPVNAQSMRTVWAFNASSQSSHPCFRNKKQVLGVITTNAMVYSSLPPKFENDELIYNVGGIHNDAEGSPFQGSYNMIIDASTALCLYGFKSVPVKATVSVASSDGTNQLVSTTSLREKDGWLYLSVSGFTFSSPLIRVKLLPPEEISPPIQNPVAVPTPAVTNTPATTLIPTTRNVTKTISCRKGTSIKKVTAANPICPKGYVKK